LLGSTLAAGFAEGCAAIGAGFEDCAAMGAGFNPFATHFANVGISWAVFVNLNSYRVSLEINANLFPCRNMLTI
jgi:hypothetical protein